MALQVALTSLQQDSCGEWVLTDSTGAYDAATNPTGWGAPNNPVYNSGTLTSATLVIKKYDGSTFDTLQTFDLLLPAIWTALTGDTNTPFSAQTTLATLVYTIDATALGAAIEDGIYQITYTVEDAVASSTITYNIATYCNIECCIEQRLANVPNEYTCVNCSNEYLETTATLWTLLQALKLAACNASLDVYMNILSTLQSACEQAGCGCE